MVDSSVQVMKRILVVHSYERRAEQGFLVSCSSRYNRLVQQPLLKLLLPCDYGE
ncbi:hypothetical protein D3C79_1085260 [compost metagenome]